MQLTSGHWLLLLLRHEQLLRWLWLRLLLLPLHPVLRRHLLRQLLLLLHHELLLLLLQLLLLLLLLLLLSGRGKE